MTTRRNLLLVAGAATLLPACRPAAARPAVVAPGAAPDVLLADSRRGLLALGGGRVDDLGPRAVTAPDGAVVCAAADDGVAGSTLTRLDPATGQRADPIRLPGRWFPRAVSPSGGACALTQVAADPAAVPAARDRTGLLVVTGDGGRRRYDLAGVVEPDAFTTDRTGLFVLEWLPAGAPDRYRVRLLDLTTGQLHALQTRDKRPVPAGAEEEMRGAGRHAVLSPDRKILYTLYTHQPGHRHTRDLIAGRPGGVHAFVHVLHLEQRWAYCLDLPHPFGEGPIAGHALAVGADGRRLAVVDVTSGSLAHADTESLTVTRVDRISPGAGAAGIAADPRGDRVFVGVGRRIQTVATDTGRTLADFVVPGVIRGLGLNGDASRLYAGGDDEIVWLEPVTGALQGRLPVAGLTALRHVR